MNYDKAASESGKVEYPNLEWFGIKDEIPAGYEAVGRLPVTSIIDKPFNSETKNYLDRHALTYTRKLTYTVEVQVTTRVRHALCPSEAAYPRVVFNDTLPLHAPQQSSSDVPQTNLGKATEPAQEELTDHEKEHKRWLRRNFTTKFADTTKPKSPTSRPPSPSLTAPAKVYEPTSPKYDPRKKSTGRRVRKRRRRSLQHLKIGETRNISAKNRKKLEERMKKKTRVEEPTVFSVDSFDIDKSLEARIKLEKTRKAKEAKVQKNKKARKTKACSQRPRFFVDTFDIDKAKQFVAMKSPLIQCHSVFEQLDRNGELGDEEALRKTANLHSFTLDEYVFMLENADAIRRRVEKQKNTSSQLSVDTFDISTAKRFLELQKPVIHVYIETSDEEKHGKQEIGNSRDLSDEQLVHFDLDEINRIASEHKFQVNELIFMLRNEHKLKERLDKMDEEDLTTTQEYEDLSVVAKCGKTDSQE